MKNTTQNDVCTLTVSALLHSLQNDAENSTVDDAKQWFPKNVLNQTSRGP